MAMSTDVYRTQFASALKYYYPNDIMQKLCYRKESVLQYINAIKAPGGGRQDMWALNTYPPDDSRALPTSATALITPTAEQFADAYVTLKTRYTRRFVNHDVLDDAATSRTALIKAVNYYPTAIADEHAFKNARNFWYTGGTYAGALGLTSVTSNSYTVNMETNFNFNRIFRGMKVDYKDTNGDDLTNGGSITISDYSEASCTITNTTTAITTTATSRIAVEDECYDSGSNTWAWYSWNSIPTVVGEGNVCNVTVSTYPEYKSRIYSSTGTLTLAKMQVAVDWVEGHSKGPLTRIHASPQAIIKYADIFLGDVRLTQDDLKRVTIGYPGQLAYRGGSMGLIPIEKDHLMPRDEIYFINWDSLKFFNSAWMKWFDRDGAIMHREQGYMNYELLFYSRGELAITNRIGCAALTGVTV